MMSTEYTYEVVSQIADFIKGKLENRGINDLPAFGIICGTGLGGLADAVEQDLSLPYNEIPYFPLSTVKGHDGKMIFGKIHSRSCLIMKGRFHMYEGYDAATTTVAVRVMKLLQVKILLVTNAAGGLNSAFNVGDLMAIKDHLYMPGLSGRNPLCGANDERFGARFPAMSEAYDRELKQIAQEAANNLNLQDCYHEGVYAMLGGPSFETIAECKMLKAMGADAVGMSTCPEVIVAVHCGMKVYGMSMITNKCVMEYDESRQANHEEVLETGRFRGEDTVKFFKEIVRLIPDSLLC